MHVPESGNQTLSAVAKVNEARTRLAQGDEGGAVALLSSALGEQPEFCEAHVLLGEISLRNASGGAGAEKMFRNALVLRPGSQHVQRLLAEALFVQGNMREAADVLITLIGKHPNDTKALVSLAKIASRVGNQSAAEAALRQALVHCPRDAAALVALAVVLRNHGNAVEARTLVERVKAVDELDLPSMMFVAEQREAQREFSQAEQIFQTALRAYPESLDTTARWGDYLKRRGRLEEALIMHRRSVGCNDTSLPPVSSRSRRVLFVVQTQSSWLSLASLYAEFVSDPTWQVTVLGAPFLHCSFRTSEEQNAVFSFLRSENIPHVRWDEFELAPGCGDIAFFYIPYEETLPVGFRVADFLRAVPRLVYVPYAFVVGAGDENTRGQFNLPLQQRAWMVCAPGVPNKDLFRRHCTTGDAHVVVSGHPKIDSIKLTTNRRDEEFQRFAAGRKIVFWNPHFDVKPDDSEFGTGYSTFLRWQSFLLAEFASRPDFAFVIRPHPLLISAFASRKFWTVEQVTDFFDRLQQAGNVLVDQRPVYLPVFADSVAMISDASSLLIEYACTGKPLLYLRNPTGPGLNETELFVKNYCASAETEAEIGAFLDDVAAGIDPKKQARMAACADCIALPPAGAGALIKQAIESRLAAEAQPLRASRDIDEAIGAMHA